MTCYFTGILPTRKSTTEADGAKGILCILRLMQVVEELIQSGCNHFITGLESSADMEFVDGILLARKKGYKVKLEAVLPPSEEQTLPQSDIDYVVKECGCDIIDREYENDHYIALIDRDWDLVERADKIFVLWDGKESGNTWDVINYARMLKKPIKCIAYERQENTQL